MVRPVRCWSSRGVRLVLLIVGAAALLLWRLHAAGVLSAGAAMKTDSNTVNALRSGALVVPEAARVVAGAHEMRAPCERWSSGASSCDGMSPGEWDSPLSVRGVARDREREARFLATFNESLSKRTTGTDAFALFEAAFVTPEVPSEIRWAIFGASTGFVTVTDDSVMKMMTRQLGASASRRARWRGVAVEPVPQAVEKLGAEKLAHFPNARIVHGVVSNACDPRGVVDFYAPSAQFFIDYVENGKNKDMPAHFQLWQLGSLDKTAFAKNFWYGEKYIHRYSVTCASAVKILAPLQRRAAGGRAVHAVLIDVQCFDHATLRGVVESTLPLILQYEDDCYSEREIESTRAELAKRGYVILDYGVNTVAVHVGGAADAASMQMRALTQRCRVRSDKLCVEAKDLTASSTFAESQFAVQHSKTHAAGTWLGMIHSKNADT